MNHTGKRLRATRTALALTLAAAGLFSAAIPARAASYFWDTNGSVAGTGTGAANNGVWGVDTFWSTSGTGGAVPTVVNTTTADDLTFSAGTNGTGNFTVTISGTQGANLILFQEGNALITGGTLNMNAAGTLTASQDAEVASSISGAATSLTKTGAGTLTLSGANTYAGTTIVGGTVIFSGSNSGGGATQLNSNSIIVLDSNLNGGLASGTIINNATTGTTVTVMSSDATTRTLSNALTVNSTTTHTMIFGGVGDLVFTGTGGSFLVNTNRIYRVDNPLTVIHSLVTSVGNAQFTKTGAGTLRLTNDNNDVGGTTGNPTFNVLDGALEFTSIANPGVVSALGDSASAQSRIHLGNLAGDATIRYVGTNPAGHSSTRQVRLLDNGGVIDASGVGTLTLNNAQVIEAASVAGATLTLAGTGKGVISGLNNLTTGGVTKTGSGTWTLSANNTYTGDTNIVGGTLVIAGSITSDTLVTATGTLAGAGTITGNVTVSGGGSHAPGNSPGIQNVVGDYALGSGGNLVMEIAGLTPGSGHDQVVVTGGVGINDANLVLVITNLYAYQPNNQIVLIVNDGSDPVTGAYFAGLPEGGIVYFDNHQFARISYVGGTGNDVVLFVLPEPTGTMMVCFGALVLLRRRRGLVT